MRPRKLKTVLVIACILAMGAGVFAGIAVSRLPARNVEYVAPAEHAELADELSLSPAQRDQMRSIWESVRSEVHGTYDKAQSLQRERDDAIVALLTPEQKAKYADLTAHAAEQFSVLNTKRDDAFRDGVEKTKKLLDERQQAKYDQILRERIGTIPGGFVKSAQPLSTPTTVPAN